MAGRPASREMLVDVTRLEHEYFARSPNVEDPNQLVNFGPADTAAHRGSSLGGPSNIEELEPCAETRLRLKVRDESQP
jgi:hypothetical protein